MGGTFLTNQLVGWSAFQGRKESLRVSPLRKTDNRIGKEGERGGREAGKKNRKQSFQDSIIAPAWGWMRNFQARPHLGLDLL